MALLLMWESWRCCPCSEGGGCGQVQKIENAPQSIIESLEGKKKKPYVISFSLAAALLYWRWEPEQTPL